MSCSLFIVQLILFCFDSVSQCVGSCFQIYANAGFLVFDGFFIALSWLITLTLSKILTYLSEELTHKITDLLGGAKDFSTTHLFVLTRICLCLIAMHLVMSIGLLLKIKFFKVLHQGLWSFKTLTICVCFFGLMIAPVKVVQILLKSLTLLLALNLILNLYALSKWWGTQKPTKNNAAAFFLFEVLLNALLVGNAIAVYLFGTILSPSGQTTLYIVSGVLCCINLIRYLIEKCRRRSLQNFIFQVYTLILLWDAWLLLQEEKNPTVLRIISSAIVGGFNVLISLFLVILAPRRKTKNLTEQLEQQPEIQQDVKVIEIDEMEAEDDNLDDEGEDENIIETVKSSRMLKKKKKEKNKKKTEKKQKKSKKKDANSPSSTPQAESKSERPLYLVHFGFLFIVAYFLKTYLIIFYNHKITLEFHHYVSQPFIIFGVATVSFLFMMRIFIC